MMRGMVLLLGFLGWQTHPITDADLAGALELDGSETVVFGILRAKAFSDDLLPLPGAVITLTTEGYQAHGVVNELGRYVIKDIPPGTHEVSSSILGFALPDIPRLEVELGHQHRQDLAMIIDEENGNWLHCPVMSSEETKRRMP